MLGSRMFVRNCRAVLHSLCSRRHSLFVAVILSIGCGATQPKRDALRVSLTPATPPAGIIFVANGAGGSYALSDSMSRAVAKARLPLQVETVAWSRGRGRVVADQTDADNHVAFGRVLAEQIAIQRRDFPGRRVYVVGHSAGCAVALAAAEQLPPDNIDRIVLLAPSVCNTYDLRPALRAARGVDSFHSEQDRWILGIGVRIVGATESDCRVAAGRVGFTPAISTAADAALYTRLHQHAWNDAMADAGNDGSHFGTHQAAFLRVYVLPLLAPEK